jgi:hypothetical protein
MVVNRKKQLPLVEVNIIVDVFCESAGKGGGERDEGNPTAGKE